MKDRTYSQTLADLKALHDRTDLSDAFHMARYESEVDRAARKFGYKFDKVDMDAFRFQPATN
jgi:hypothetical protein